MAVRNKLTRNFVIAGVALGLAITFFVTQSVLGMRSMPFTFSNIGDLHDYSVFYLVDLLPVALGLFAFVFGRFFESNLRTQRAEIDNMLERKARLQAFSDEILAGNVDTDIDDATRRDALGQTLDRIRGTIINDKRAEEMRKQEDSERQWTAEGLALFAEILRRNNDNIEALSLEIISNLCKYADAVQGGFFVLNDADETDVHFELLAHYAYNRQKFSQKRIEWNEGLIGRSAFEKRTLLLDDIAEGYLEVTSGLGEATPRHLLITPLIFNEQIQGVIEIAGFDPFPKYKIDFIEKISESIGNTYGNVKVNIRTAKLLGESQEQAERLAQQEEEMRQNMEELQATQEEAAKQAEQFISFTNSVNHTLIRADYDINGILIYANTKFLKKLDYQSMNEVEGHHIGMFISEKDREWFDSMWGKLVCGGQHFEGYMKHITKRGKDLWTMATYTPTRNADGAVEKILFLAIDTTEQKERSLEFEGQMKALNMSNMKVDFMVSGKLVDCNEKFQSAFGYSANEMKQKSFFDFFDEKDQSMVEDIWNNVVNGIPFEGQVRMLTKYSDPRWLQTTLVATYNMYGDIDKIICVANDVTEQKDMELQIKKKNKMLLAQEEKLKNSETELSRKLEKAKKELRQHFNEIEKVKIRNELTLEGALDAIVTFNSKGTIEFFNQAAENLWEVNKKLVLGRNMRVLFNDNILKENDFAARIVDPDKEKIVGVRTEIPISTKSGERKQVLCLLSAAVLDDTRTYTAFIQNIEVELF